MIFYNMFAVLISNTYDTGRKDSPIHGSRKVKIE
jgi:hypothetical protein